MALCNARRRNHPPLRCRAHAMPNGRCRMHGGKHKGPITAEGKKRSAEARMAGFQRWVQRMRDARDLGIIPELPWQGWNRPKGLHTLARQSMKEAALAIIDKEIEQLPAPVEKPLEQQTMGELLSGNARLALVRARAILTLECEDDNYKLMSIQKDLIGATITTQVRVDESVMRRQSADRLPELLRRIAAIQASDVQIAEAQPQFIDITPEDDT